MRADSSGQWSYTDQSVKRKDGVYQLTVRATDQAGNESVESEALVFTVDTLAPLFTSPDLAPALDENSGDNQLIYTATSVDESVMSYSIDDTEHFSIDSFSGDVRFLLNPDYENPDQQQPRSFVITAHDQAGNSSEQNVRFEVNNIDDTPPKFTSGGKAKVKGALSDVEVIYQAKVDDDSPVMFGLDDDEGDSAYFDIDSETGIIVLDQESNIEAKSKYAIYVTAEDSFGNISKRKVNVSVKDVSNSNDSEGSEAVDAPSDSDVVTGQTIRLTARENYTKKSAQIITDFDPTFDRLQIFLEDFGLESEASFGVPKNKKMFKALQNSDIDFISKVNKENVFILFNQNGPQPGLGDFGGVVAVIMNSPQFNHSQFTADLVELI